MPGVAMTSNVKSERLIIWHVLHPVSSSSGCTASVGRVGARKTRRLSLLLSVGWLPPSLSPSGVCLGIEGVPHRCTAPGARRRLPLARMLTSARWPGSRRIASTNHSWISPARSAMFTTKVAGEAWLTSQALRYLSNQRSRSFSAMGVLVRCWVTGSCGRCQPCLPTTPQLTRSEGRATVRWCPA